MSDLSVQILKKKILIFPFARAGMEVQSENRFAAFFFMKVDFPFVDSDGRGKIFAECSSQYAICIYMQPDI